MATIGTILIQASNQIGGITGGGSPSMVGVGDSTPSGDLRSQKKREDFEKKNLEQGEKAPKFWTAAFKKMGIQMGLAGILKQSQIFTSTIGSLFQIFGAFVDIILAPFVPLFIPAIRWLARKMPTVAKWAEGNAFKEFIKDPMKHFKIWWGTTWTAIKAWGKTMFDEVKWALGDFLEALPIVGGKVPVSLQRPKPVAALPGEESDWSDTAKAAADKAWKAYLATAALRAAAELGAPLVRSKVPTTGLARPIGKVLDWSEEALSLPNQTANRIIKLTVQAGVAAAKTAFWVGGSALDVVAGSHFNVPQWAKMGGAGGADLAESADDIPFGWRANLRATSEKPSLWRRALNLAGNIPGNIPGSGLLNNSMLRALGRGVTGPVGTGVAAMYEVSEGIYDTMNLANEDKPWFGGINPNAFGMDTFKPWKKDAWLPSPDTNLLTGKLDEVIMRGLGTAMIPLGAFGGQVGANIGMGVSEYTAWGTGTQRQDLFGDFIGPSIADGFRRALNGIPGI